MDLKIEDVAGLLNVTETTIRRLLVEDKIPSYKLDREYRFSKIEIENWMLEKNFSAPKELPPSAKEEQIYPVKGSGKQHYSLYRAINHGGVHQNVKGETKEELIRNSVELIAPALRLDPDILSELLLDREKLMPTSFSGGIAVPHARECLQKVPYDLVAVVFPEKPVEYGALDGKPVDTLFFLFAREDKMHLHLLSKIAHFSSNKEGLEMLKSQPEKAKLLEFVRGWESNLRV